MKKIVITTIGTIAFFAGVLIGNQYGRRDIVNSRPPRVEGVALTDNPVVLSENDSKSIESSTNLKLNEPLFLFTDSGFVIYGALSATIENNIVKQALVNVWKMPSGVIEGVENSEFTLSLYNKNDKLQRNIQNFILDEDLSAIISVGGIEIKSGDYFGISPSGSDAVILKSENFK